MSQPLLPLAGCQQIAEMIQAITNLSSKKEATLAIGNGAGLSADL